MRQVGRLGRCHCLHPLQRRLACRRLGRHRWKEVAKPVQSRPFEPALQRRILCPPKTVTLVLDRGAQPVEVAVGVRYRYANGVALSSSSEPDSMRCTRPARMT